MVFENLEVVHNSFGRGIVLAKSGKYITVKFDSCQKTFVYPDAFERFLTLSDGGVSEKIKRDIEIANIEKEKILSKKNEENIRSMIHGIVIPGKENAQLDSDDEDAGFKSSENEEL